MSKGYQLAADVKALDKVARQSNIGGRDAGRSWASTGMIGA
jgi:hypothetical protein